MTDELTGRYRAQDLIAETDGFSRKRERAIPLTATPQGGRPAWSRQTVARKGLRRFRRDGRRSPFVPVMFGVQSQTGVLRRMPR